MYKLINFLSHSFTNWINKKDLLIETKLSFFALWFILAAIRIR